MNAIAEYLQDKKGGYRHGIALLKTVHGRALDIAELSAFADKQFAPTWAERKLMDILRGYVERAKQIDFFNGAKIELQPIQALSSRGQSDAKEPVKVEPKAVTRLRTEEYALREERRPLHFGLEDTEDEAVRAEKVLTIRGLTERINACWTQIDAYELNGTLPVFDVAKTDDTPLTAFDLQRKLLSIRPRLSKLKGLLETDLPESKRIRYTREMGEKNAELIVIEQQLNPMNAA